jgi:hypothetical protein
MRPPANIPVTVRPAAPRRVPPPPARRVGGAGDAATDEGGVWLPVRAAARVLGVSTDTIHRRGVPWQAAPVPFKLRYKLLVLAAGDPGERRYHEPDLLALLCLPPPAPTLSGTLIPRRAASGPGVN